MKKGTLIVIDGGDGAGKHTQTELLVEKLRSEGVVVETLDFPQYKTNTFGALIRECLDGKRGDFLAVDPRIASTLYAADRFETKPILDTWLEEGKVVVLDRYATSNILHQGTKVKNDDELQALVAWLDQIEYDIFGIPRPDLSIYLHVDPEERMSLIQHATDRQENVPDMAETNLQHQIDTDATAKKIIEMFDGWSAVECMQGGAMRSREDIHEEIYKIVKEQIEK